MSLTWALLPAPSTQPGIARWLLADLAPLWLAASVLVGFIVGVWLTGLIPSLRRLFIPRSELTDEVDRLSQKMFFDSRIHHATTAGGILVFVSLFERRAVVLADQRVLAAVGQERIRAWCDRLTQQAGSAGVIPALCGAIEEIGRELSARFPVEPNPQNLLPDALVTLAGP